MTEAQPGGLLGVIAAHQDASLYQSLLWEGSFGDYLDLVKADAKIARNAYQRLYDLIESYGTTEYTEYRKEILRHHFFDDPFDHGADGVFGIDIQLMKLVRVFRAAALGYGPEKRVILLHGPVGSAKSTIARLLKKGLEAYSRTDAGKLFTYSWEVDGQTIPSPMNDEPLKLLPDAVRGRILSEINATGTSPYPVKLEGDLNPVCRYWYRELMRRYDGDFLKVVSHVKVRRLVLSEKDRVGIGTFQPKDEKNQDSTELTGDINYRKIAEYGSDSDPRAFNFDGEFCVANRGIIEFVEMLKLDVAFLYDLLGASQEHRIKPKKFAQTSIDEVIIGHTNEPEYRRLQSNEYMEALRDRTIRIDVPYITKPTQEVRIYKKDFNKQKVSAHIAPHTLEIAALWAVLTRLEEPTNHKLSLLQKSKLYDGRNVRGFTEDHVKELRKAASKEGLIGISPRYVQDKISNALVKDPDLKCLNPFMVLNELESGLKSHSLISNDEEREKYKELLGVVKEEYTDIVKNEVQKAIAADEGAMKRLCSNYIDNLRAYVLKEKVRNSFTGEYEEPNERLMRSIEDKIDIPEARKDDFRRELMNYIAALALDGKTFDYTMNERLHRALELKLFEDSKDSIKLTSLVSETMDPDTQAKIEVVKQRLIDHYGYDEISATDVLHYVASIFARGDASKK
ncbi:MAG: serine protein kinase [Alphaproteobacteria bacterium]|nr:serine protein kinase [Alphaproteobacteria bacterium]MCB9695927.1 serine protein kinase [Alphaproteobacteria bacterium]